MRVVIIPTILLTKNLIKNTQELFKLLNRQIYNTAFPGPSSICIFRRVIRLHNGAVTSALLSNSILKNILLKWTSKKLPLVTRKNHLFSLWKLLSLNQIKFISRIFSLQTNLLYKEIKFIFEKFLWKLNERFLAAYFQLRYKMKMMFFFEIHYCYPLLHPCVRCSDRNDNRYHCYTMKALINVIICILRSLQWQKW